MPLRVLVMDDAKNTVDAICRLLSVLGYEAAACTEGCECVELAKHFQPDVILLDLAMPGIDGFHLAEHLRACPDLKCRIIALSGHADSATRDRCALSGFDAFL